MLFRSEISTFGPGVTWASRDSRFQGSAQLQFTRTRTGNAGTDAEAAPRFLTRWGFARGQALVLRGNFRRYDYASPTIAEFNERLATLEYVTSL